MKSNTELDTLELETRLATEQGLCRVPPDKCGLYGHTLVFRSGDNKFSEWRGDITAKAGRISYPIYVKNEHAHYLGHYASGVEALVSAIGAGLKV